MLSETYLDLVNYRTLINSDMGALSAEALAAFGAESMLAFRKALEQLSGSSKWLRNALVLSGLSWVLIIKFAGWVRAGGKRRNILGSFVPLTKDESRINIKSGRHLRSNEPPTVSHEHLHLLQFRNRDRDRGHAREVKSPSILFAADALSHRDLRYLLESDEMEARLHEAVLSYYRLHRRLPSTEPAFLELLASHPQFGWLIKNAAAKSKREIEGSPAYPLREAMFAEQLESVFVLVESPDKLYRFVTEVLTVMYGNLLRYYGDPEASQRFMSKIPRPNLYDDLYGGLEVQEAIEG